MTHATDASTDCHAHGEPMPEAEMIDAMTVMSNQGEPMTQPTDLSPDSLAGAPMTKHESMPDTQRTPAPVLAPREKKPISRTTQRRLEKRAAREAEWFYVTLGGRVPEAGPPQREAAMAIEGWLRRLLTFHRGALALWYAKGDWPAPLRQEFNKGVSLVVRLDCAQHPAVGRPVDELERGAAERLSARILRKGVSDDRELRRLATRAKRHFRMALRALVELRGRTPCRVPAPAHRTRES